MFVDARRIPSGTELAADLCIVGAGAAGISIARELAGSRVDVVLLESGGFRRDGRTHRLSVAESVGLRYGPVESTRSRLFGGSTSCWGGWCRPLEEVDFERRPWVAHSGWPISRSDLLPYYERASRVLEIGPLDYDADAWRRRIAKTRAQLIPFDSSRVVNELLQFSPPTRFGTRYRSDLGAAANIRTFLYANVTELELDEGAAAVTQINVATLTGASFRVLPRAVVLALGGIDNARLLLLSRRVAVNGIGNEHDLVGRFFAEHPRLVGGDVTPATSVSLDFYDASYSFHNPHFALGGVSAAVYASVAPALRRDEELLGSRVLLQTAFFGDAAEGTEAARRLVHTMRGHGTSEPLHREIRRVLADAAPVALAAASRLVRPRRLIRARRLVTIVEPEPTPKSRVTLSAERDALGLNRARVDWQLTERTRRTIARSRQIVAAELERVGAARVTLDRDEGLEPDASWPETLLWCWHHIGTTRMSASPKEGVVDATCRVHGIGNLYVAGSSVFPTAGTDVPTLTIVALALRLADHLRATLAHVGRQLE